MSGKSSDYSDRLVALTKAAREGDGPRVASFLADPELRARAAQLLGDLDERAAAPNIIPLLSAADSGVRVAAARALGRLQARAAAPQLLELAQSDPSRLVRSWAVEALGRIGDPVTTGPVVALLADPEWWVRRAAARALGRAGSGSAYAELKRAARRERLGRRRPYRLAMRDLHARGIRDPAR